MDDSGLPSEVRARIASSGGFISSSELRHLGLGRRELDGLLATGALERVRRGMFAPALRDATVEQTYRRLVLAALASRSRAAPAVVVAGPAAVVLHGLPLFGSAPARVHVGGPRAGGRKASEVFRPVGLHRPADTVTVDGLLVATPARAIVDTARLMSVVGGTVAADAALSRRLVTRGELDDAVTGASRLQHVARARRAVRLSDGRSESPGESWSAVVLDDLGVLAPRRQHLVVDSEGPVGRVDFWWPAHRVVGEFDGRVKYGRVNPSGRSPEEVLWAEKLREDRLRRLGLAVVRWTAADLRRPHTLVSRLRGVGLL